MLLISMLLFFCLPSSSAQTLIPKRSHSINKIGIFSAPNVPDTLTIVAVRVEFQRDNNRLTSGNGTFDSGNLSYLNKPKITIDPLPHDRSYFEAHLEFAKNYFEQVSGNKITVEYRLLPDIYQLPKKMETYSPTGRTFTNEKIANFVKDTWETVDEQGGFPTSDLNPQKTVFAIFHAGVGRDIELTGTTLDKTPQDIPSLYLGQQSLTNLLNDPNFDGFDINGNFRVTNSMVLPRTLSRRGENIASEEFVLQLSINGLLCASIGSYLGLPDLFNTQTGNSGIGRFGLMDGESFFSYRGLFPPEPSAWEKTYLGWQTPFPISTTTSGAISLPTASMHQHNSIAKYALSGSEYFLIENRHRDANNNGVTITFRQADGTTQTKQFDNDDTAFVNQTGKFTESLVRGVVANVSDYDWSLPGSVDQRSDGESGTSDDRLLNGGILIWHIDEAVIKNELQSQTVNANPQRRGVDLEEADGAQDIGRAASSDFSEQARGTAFDFWWDGNDASVITLQGDTLRFYENRFGPDTHPSNESNSGAPSFFELYDFSQTKPTASFRIRPASRENIQPIALPIDGLADQTTFTTNESNYLTSYPLTLSLYTTSTDSFLIIPSQQTIYALNLSGGNNPVFDFQSGIPQQPYLGNAIILGDAPMSAQIEVTSWQWDGLNWVSNWNTQADANHGFLSSVRDQNLLLDFTDQRIDIATGNFQSPLNNAGQRSASRVGQFSFLSGNSLSLQPENQSYTIAANGDRKYTGALDLSNSQSGFYFLSDRNLLVFEPDNFSRPKTIISNSPFGWPAMTDINSDGNIDFIYVNKETHSLEARNLNGTLISHFPIRPPEGTRFTGTPLIATSDKFDSPTLYITSQDSLSMNIHAYSAEGEVIAGFPLYIGGVSEQDNQPIHPLINQKTLYAVSHRGQLKAWQLNTIDEVLWGSRYGNGTFNKVSGNLDASPPPQSPTVPNQILKKSETYNWPNPAKDFTNLRFQTSGSGVVDIKIITPGGDVIFDQRYQAQGAMPEEHQIATQHWSNGIYFGMITATVDGKKSRKMIKIVVIH